MRRSAVAAAVAGRSGAGRLCSRSLPRPPGCRAAERIARTENKTETISQQERKSWEEGRKGGRRGRGGGGRG